MLLTIYGDYALRADKAIGIGEEIGIGSLVKLLSNFGLSEQATRSAVSRMCRAELLKSRTIGRKSYYSLTKDGQALLHRGAKFIFGSKESHWDGAWSIVIYSIPEKRRSARDRLRLELGSMGFGALSNATWISPNDLVNEVKISVERLKVKEHVQIFRAELLGFTSTKDVVSQCWNLRTIHQEYAKFLAKYSPKLQSYLERLQAGTPFTPGECFVKRAILVQEYRNMHFLDPHLPQELLPKNWLRPQASAVFNQYHDLLADKASQYFISALSTY